MLQDYYEAVEIERKTNTDNEYGGTSYTWSKVLDTQGLINQPNINTVAKIADMYQIKSVYNFYTDSGQDIRQDDRVKWNGEYYRVVSDPLDTVNRGHHFKFILEMM